MPGSPNYLRGLTLGAFAISTQGLPGCYLLWRVMHMGPARRRQSDHHLLRRYAIDAPVMVALTTWPERWRLLAVAIGGFSWQPGLAAVGFSLVALLAIRGSGGLPASPA